MAKLFIAEYANFAGAPNHLIQAPLEPPQAEQVIDFTSGPAVSNVFSQYTRLIRLVCDTPCSVSIGVNPTANADSGRMPADTVEFRGIPEGSAFKISAISNV
jgi:hypothetical protein